MAFDNTNAADLLALKTEQATDPISMGYAAVDGQTKQTLDLFNDPLLNVGLDEVDERLTPALLLASIVPDDLTVSAKFTQGELEWLKLLVEASTSLTDDLTVNRDKIVELFNQTPTLDTYTNLVALKRRISRAEVLFGVGTVISRTDWFAARDS